MVDICQAAKLWGKYPLLFTDTELNYNNYCFSIYQTSSIASLNLKVLPTVKNLKSHWKDWTLCTWNGERHIDRNKFATCFVCWMEFWQFQAYCALVHFHTKHNLRTLFNLLMNTTLAGHYSLGNVHEVIKLASRNLSLNYADKMLQMTLNVKKFNKRTEFDRSLIS